MKARYLVLALLVLALVLPMSAGAQATDPASVGAAWYDLTNAGDLDAVMMLFADDAVVDAGPFGLYTGLAEIRAWAEPQITVQNAQVEYELLNVEGDVATFMDHYTSDVFDFVIEMTDHITVKGGKITYYTVDISDEMMVKLQAWMARLPNTGVDLLSEYLRMAGMAAGGLAIVAAGGYAMIRRRRKTRA